MVPLPRIQDALLAPHTQPRHRVGVATIACSIAGPKSLRSGISRGGLVLLCQIDEFTRETASITFKVIVLFSRFCYVAS